MNKSIIPFLLFSLTVIPIGFADQAQQVITLKDGSQIKGELSGIENGVYTVKTPIIGEIHVAASDVASITANGAPAGVALPSNTGTPALPTMSSSSSGEINQQQLMAQQQKLMSNPQAMADLQQIAQDPEIMQALSDPALVQAVTSHDYQAVQNNPKVQELMSNPKMQALLQKLAAQQQNTSSQ